MCLEMLSVFGQPAVICLAVVALIQCCALGDDCMVVEWLPDVEC